MNIFGQIKFNSYVWSNNTIEKNIEGRVVKRGDKIIVDNKKAKTRLIENDIVLVEFLDGKTDIYHFSKIKKRKK